MFEIRMLNDDFRRTFHGGKVMLTHGVANLPPDELLTLQNKVRSFDNFTEDNDPYGEHDFGVIEHNGTKYYFKIDYYDRALEAGSEDPANPDVTTRVMTILRADEY